jgi:hypothetical protein
MVTYNKVIPPNSSFKTKRSAPTNSRLPIPNIYFPLNIESSSPAIL